MTAMDPLMSQLGLSPVSSAWTCLMIWTPDRTWLLHQACSAHLAQVLWDGPRMVRSLLSQPLSSGQALLLQPDPSCAAVWERDEIKT